METNTWSFILLIIQSHPKSFPMEKMKDLPHPKARTILHLGTVQRVTAFDGNLIMMNLGIDIFIADMFNLIMVNLQMARESVSQMATVWIINVKLVWKSMKIPHSREY